ncbi:MAG: zinc-dependent metalloprotease [Bacteriovoracia bacterium]
MRTLLLLAMHLASLPAFADPDIRLFPYRQKIGLFSFSPSSSDKLPKQALDLLRKHPVWQTVAGLSIPGFSPLLSANRRWIVDGSGSSLKLIEQSELSLSQDCATKKYTRWGSAKLELSGSVRPMDFIIGGPDFCAPTKPAAFTVTFLGEDRFVIKPAEAGIAVLFFPAQNLAVRGSKKILDAVHVFTAPVGPTTLGSSTGLEIPRSDYFHHDLSRPMPVVLDKSFPDAFLAILESSLSKWNAALGTNFFRLQAQKEEVDPYDCLSSRKLCFLWNGSTEISFLGAGGITGMVFDPISGQIQGGYIGIDADSRENLPAVPLTPEILKFESEQASVEDAAVLFSRRDELAQFRHPKPSWQLGYVFTHELGHFNGLGHNFLGSYRGSSFHKTDSVMDYAAFSAVDSKSSELGKFDLEAVALIYKNEKPGLDYLYCGDDESNLEGVSKNPNCNKFDLGRPDRWFITLAKIAPEGVFAKHPRFEGINLDYLGSFLEANKPGVMAGQTDNVQGFLCANYSADRRVYEYLQANNAIRLECR